VNAVSAFGQHADRGVEVFPLVAAIEGIGEQDDLAAINRPDGLGARFKRVAAERR